MIARIREELQTQYHRYTTHKYGKLAALGIYYLLFTQVPPILIRLLPYVLQRVSQELAFVIIIFTAMVGTGLFLNLFMWFVYKIKHPFFEQYRVDANREWPWQKNSVQWQSRLLRSLGLNVLNLCIIAPLLFFIDALVDFKFIMDMSKTPTVKQMLKYLVLFHLFQDFFFFTTHYLLHTRFLYKNIHKIHHEYNTSVTMAGLHFHIVQFLISNSIPAKLYFMLTAYILGPIHVTTVTIWMILRIADAYNGHSGYIFSWAPLQLLPFCSNDDFHDFHHSQNYGNYGSQFRFWDSLFGTNEIFREYKRKQRQQMRQNKQK